jgi:uncharacterized protein (TIGR02145 family)
MKLTFTSALFGFCMAIAALPHSHAQEIKKTEKDENLPVFLNGFYLIKGYYEGTKDTLVKDTFSMERNGDYLIFRPANAKKITHPLHGLIDDDRISVHSYPEDCYGSGSFFFHCTIKKDTVMGHGAIPKKTDKTFRVSLTRIAIPLIDARDGQHYATVRIGNQFWMAENLRYADTLGGIWVNKDPSFPKNYGMFYSWDAIDRVCPKGWHVPTRDEWKELSDFLGTKIAGIKLKSVSGWSSEVTGGEDKYGFAAYPAGYYNPETETFKDIGEHAFFWAIDQQNIQNSWYRNLYSEYPGLYEFNDRKEYGLSCRCIQD